MVTLNSLTSITVYLLYFFFSDPDSHLCTQKDRKPVTCPAIYQPVCALIRGTNSDSALSDYRYYQKTLGSACSACSSTNVIGYVPGECPDTEAQICSKKLRNGVCTQEYDPVCTISEKKDTKKPYTKRVSAETSSNGCTACKSVYSKFHIAGKCASIDDPKICQSKDRKAQICTLEYNPVCAYYKGKGCKEEICRRTESNYCAGCKDSNVIFVIPGACENN